MNVLERIHLETIRAVASLPRWLVEEFSSTYPVYPVRLGKKGLQKEIFIGIRKTDADIVYLKAFIELARAHRAECAEPLNVSASKKRPHRLVKKQVGS